MDDILPGLIESRAKVFYTMGAYTEFDQRMIGWVNRPACSGEAGRTLAA